MLGRRFRERVAFWERETTITNMQVELVTLERGESWMQVCGCYGR